MNTKSYLATSEEINQLITTYKQYQQISKNPYIKFFAKTSNETISIYTSNKVVIQSKSNLELKQTSKPNLNSNQLVLGSDEVGCGDIFGPVVACCVSIKSKQQLQLLQTYNFQDSKKYSDSKIINLAQTIINNNLCDYNIFVLDNEKYNVLIQQMNQNELKMFIHLQARSKFDENLPWVIDAFSTLNSLQQYQINLQEKGLVTKNFEFEAYTKAENKYLSVALSSILARYYFLRKMYVLSSEVNESLKLGASLEASMQYQKLKNNFDMRKYAKLNFKNLK